MKTESMMERPMLGQFLDVLINSDRIVIYDGEDSKSPELYRGYVACFNYDSGGIDTSRRVAKTGLGCEIFRVEKQDLSPFVHTKTLGAEVPVISLHPEWWREIRKEYAGDSGKPLWGWHISHLREYEKPLSLSEVGVKKAPQSWCYLGG